MVGNVVDAQCKRFLDFVDAKIDHYYASRQIIGFLIGNNYRL